MHVGISVLCSSVICYKILRLMWGPASASAFDYVGLSILCSSIFDMRWNIALNPFTERIFTTTKDQRVSVGDVCHNNVRSVNLNIHGKKLNFLHACCTTALSRQDCGKSRCNLKKS